ncbi:acyl-CoA N-acyltransferase [Neocallimastix lanati (nom. inval.)]|jgi:RimJ/RimL family protein N-acetyltransferase|uniref:Acyl-CoA N-acyltransferase n=1 Tax=Neocallimastix californiae TaxID=1754190 RepID=A0A1Y2DRW1_9FUNG|nr:acyl-CoA N-acyltransferase [Neocallimastix sp. JGI-2020a]ORY62012.1 acyl-CoA N-acyltransferase [Neocallimastix californiae]|eukprot:ORY62012.1 acyl-CoA N-acyltransferase [Neocallimastix californiae]
MSIILCDKSHLKDLVEFYEDEIRYLEQNINYPDWKLGSYPSERSILGAIMANSQYAYIKDGEIIGAVVLNDEPGCKYENANIACKYKEYMVIHALGTSHKYYKKGIASEIVNYCIEKAKKEGYKGIYCDAAPKNTVSRNLFLKLGFKDLGVFDLDKTIIGIHNEILTIKELKKLVPDLELPVDFHVFEMVF